VKRGKALVIKQKRSEYLIPGISQKTPERTDDELRADYMATFVKYALQGIHIEHPEKVPIFKNKAQNKQHKKALV
jgi:hypothetical protein